MNNHKSTKHTVIDRVYGVYMCRLTRLPIPNALQFYLINTANTFNDLYYAMKFSCIAQAIYFVSRPSRYTSHFQVRFQQEHRDLHKELHGVPVAYKQSKATCISIAT